MFNRLKLGAAVVAAGALLSQRLRRNRGPRRARCRFRLGRQRADLRPPLHGAEHRRQRVRHHRPRGGQGDGRHRCDQERRGVQPRRCRRHRRPGPDRVGEGQRQAADDDGPRRRRRPVHQQVRGQARPDHADRQADRGVRRHRGGQELPVQDDRRPGRRPGRPTPRRWRSAVARCRAARTTCCRCSWLRRSGIDPKEVNFISYDGGGDLLPAVLGGKVAFGASGLRRVPRPGRGRRGAGPGHQRSRSRSTSSTPRR